MTNNQSKIEKLISKLCPNGVKFKELGDVLKRTKGTPITAGQMSKINKEDAPIKIFAGGRTVAYVDYGDIPDKDVLTKESVVVKSRGIIAFEYIDKPFSHKNEFWSYHSNNSDINIKYVYYYLKDKEVYFQTVGKKMSKMPQLSIPDTDNFKIPLPPLAIQEEIVKILNSFTELETELEIELEARKKQYEHYRLELLTFGDDVKRVVLGECIEKNIGGGTPSKAKESYWNGDIPWASVGDLTVKGNCINTTRNFITAEGLKNSSSHLIPKGSVIVAVKISPGKMKITNSDIAINQDLRGLSLCNLLNPKFLVYYSQTINVIGNGTIVKGITVDTLNKIKIPVPPITEQERIVSILDKFDSLVNDISIGLPAELSARRQQYEYYRGKLLDFPLKKA